MKQQHLCFDQGPAIAALDKKLSLGVTGSEHDWDIELADPERLEEFLSFYIENDTVLTKNEKYCLASIIVASFDEVIFSKAFNNNIWGQISAILMKEKELFLSLMEYWASPLDGNDFNVSFHMRRLLNADTQ